jgi:hypothetical protein
MPALFYPWSGVDALALTPGMDVVPPIGVDAHAPAIVSLAPGEWDSCGRHVFLARYTDSPLVWLMVKYGFGIAPPANRVIESHWNQTVETVSRSQ